MYETPMKNRQQALITRYFSNSDKGKNTTPAAVSEKDDDDDDDDDDGDDDDLLVHDRVAPEDLGHEYKSFALTDYALE